MDEKKETRLCPYSRRCSGCQLQNMTYTRQLKHKQITAIKLLGRFAHVEEIIGMAEPFHYRNKVSAMFGAKNGRLFSGIYQSTGKNIVPVEECLIEDKTSQEIISSITKLAQSFKMQAFSRETGRGFLKHILVRRGFKSGQIMAVIVTGEGAFPSQRSFVNAVIKKHPEITTLVRNINKSRVGLLLGKDNEVLFGSGYIEDELLGMKFRISPQSFYQVNPVQTEVLYGKAAEFAGLSGEETLLDCYCGTGTIGLIMSKKAKRVIGAELNPEAVNDAKANAALNGVTNAEFLCCDAGEFMTQLAERGESADVVITDPPRAGCSREFLSALVKMSPKRVVYVSCNPETLARDLRFLTKNGYRAQIIQPVDMFPFTSHVECVVSITKTSSHNQPEKAN